MTPPPKEDAHAFMPSSNDSLYSPSNGIENASHNPFHQNFPSSQELASQPDDELAVLSNCPTKGALLAPPDIHPPNGTISPTDMTGLPSRGIVASASPIPQSTSASRPATDQTFWHDHFQQTVELHKKERKLWEEEKQFLEREISRLRQQIQNTRSNSAVSRFSGKENDKVFPNAEVIRQSQEKLRSLSNASHDLEQSSSGLTSVRKTSQDLSSPYGQLERRRHSSSAIPQSISGSNRHLASISENEPAEEISRRVSISNVDANISDPSAVDISQGDDPPSPPTTAYIPTPPNAKKHAGRTPPVPRTPDDDASLEDMHESTTRFYGNIADEDPALDSPKVLPSKPSSATGSELSDLNKRLERVASDPEANLPEAVRAPLEVPSASTSPSADPQQNDGGEVKLKTKRSMNFGAPLGDPIRDRKMS